MSQSTVLTARPAEHVGALTVVPFVHPQGCRSYLLVDPTSKQALALDPHLDLVDEISARVADEGWSLPYVVDSHTHADHPSGAGGLAARHSSTRIAHEKAHHRGVARHPDDGDTLHLGDHVVTVRHAPGHTPDHIVFVTDKALFSGDTLFIDSVARTDFLGGDAGQLHDTIHAIIKDLPDETLLYPGHDYEGRFESTIGAERTTNPWLEMDRDGFVSALTANPPPRPANMDDLLRLNREGVDIPSSISAAEAVQRVNAGGATSVIDVRTGAEMQAEHIKGSRHVVLDQVKARVDDIRATPAPRLLMCRTGNRAQMAKDALEPLGVGGLVVVDGGIEAYEAAGGEIVKGKGVISLERQVRIGAGSLVVLSVVLALTVTPWFIALAAFVGAGLVFAGVTDFCGMGLVLAKAPWNRAEFEVGADAAGGCAATPAAGGCAASHVAPPPAQGGGCAAPKID